MKNAISLNEALIERLQGLLGRLEESLAKCRAKYESNDQILMNVPPPTEEKPRNNAFMDTVSKKALYCGAPYFKTLSGKVAPPNEEALYRRQQGTMYPMHYRANFHTHWTMADKTYLMKSIKEAMWSFYRSKGNDKTITLSMNAPLRELVEKLQNLPMQLDWELISDRLCSRHTASECQAMWNLNLHPKFRRGKWSEEEDDALLESAREHNFQNWERIAIDSDLQRSMFQCFLHYQTTYTDTERSMERFSKEEDERILKLVKEYRQGSVIPWSKIAKHFTNRNKQTVYYRYTFSLNPNINRERFSVEEDCIFLAAVQQYGMNFGLIAKELPNRTLVQLRAHYANVLQRNSTLNPWTVEEDKMVLKLHTEGKTWAEMAKVIDQHNRQQIRQRWAVIDKYFKRDPNATIEKVPKRKRAARNGVTTANWGMKIAELGRPVLEAPKINFNTVVVKLSSFIHLLDIQITGELIRKFEDNFNSMELDYLNAVLEHNSEEDEETPTHRPVLLAFQNMRTFLGTTNGKTKTPKKTFSKKQQVEKDNFKKQFKALFYLPALLAHVQRDKRSKTLDTKFGSLTVTY